MDNKVNETPQRQRQFIRCGTNFIDISACISLSFYKPENGYASCQFIYEDGRALHLPVNDRNEFSHILLQLERYIPDTVLTLGNINAFIKKVEQSDANDYQTFVNNSGQQDNDVDDEDDDNENFPT